MGNVIKKLDRRSGGRRGALVGITKALEFPVGFPVMFFAYAILGAAVFIIAGLAVAHAYERGKALIVLVAFYIVLCIGFIAGASMWPQYDPEDEKGKIDKI